MKRINNLSKESSPYLLQHKNNPVNWIPWSEEVFERAKKEDKLVLISIGYSACHWCHIMEKESFEDEVVARIMNENFICVKVDREERPDVDQLYMNAVQLMTNQGGWPLNCFTLPNGKPVYGGTYFKKKQWIETLSLLHTNYRKEKIKFEEYSQKLFKAIKSYNLIESNKQNKHFSKEKIDEMIVVWKRSFDKKMGGNNYTPKFPMPNNFEFLLKYAILFDDKEVENYVTTTLNKIAQGGIHDQIGGGFSRYSIDKEWKVPHFEKMLYDNAQLMSVYAKAYSYTKNDEYRYIVYQINRWINREMTLDNGAFYSAIDADSENEEGKFYIWKKQELKNILLDEEYDFVEKIYNVNHYGYWENENYVLIRSKSLKENAQEMHLTIEKLYCKINEINHKILSIRSKRVFPEIDDKSITSWNALMVSAYVDAYKSIGEEHFFNQAKRNIDWILKQQKQENGKLWHTYKNKVSKIDGFLDDYAILIQACLDVYEVTFNSLYLKEAQSLTELTIQEFFDEKSGMFWFTNKDSKLIVRKMELIDNVIPASNSIMAKNLYKLSRIFDDKGYAKKTNQMLGNIYEVMHTYPSEYSNWGQLLLDFIETKQEIVIVGKNAHQLRREIQKIYLPNVLIVGTIKKSELPLFKNRFKGNKTYIYYCKNNTCQLPVESIVELKKIMHL